MIPSVTLPVPVSLASLLAVFGPLFTAPSYRTFCGLACGFLAQTGRGTVCGMLTGASLPRLWPHDRAASNRSEVIAYGAFTSHAVKVTHSRGTGTQHFDPSTCPLLVSRHGTYTIVQADAAAAAIHRRRHRPATVRLPMQLNQQVH